MSNTKNQSLLMPTDFFHTSLLSDFAKLDTHSDISALTQKKNILKTVTDVPVSLKQ